MTRIEELVALAEVHAAASRMLDVERLLYASMSGLQYFSARGAQLTRIEHLERVVESLAKQMTDDTASLSTARTGG